MTTPSDPSAFLRRSLLGNVAFSVASGLTFAIAASAVATFLGLPQVAIVRAVGIGLLGFAAYVGFVATRPEIDLAAAFSIILGDLAWVVGTIPIVMLDLLSPNGVIAALAIADMVLLFAILQYIGLRRVRAHRPAPLPSNA